MLRITIMIRELKDIVGPPTREAANCCGRSNRQQKLMEHVALPHRKGSGVDVPNVSPRDMSVYLAAVTPKGKFPGLEA